MLPFATVNIGLVARWVSSIPFEDWPQQHRLDDGELRPAMMSDLAWHGFGEITDGLEREIMAHFEGWQSSWRTLSVVMPGHAIPSHTDAQRDDWLTRVHVPLLSNPSALFLSENSCHRLIPGMAYKIDTRLSHGVANGGSTPRVHFFLDIRRND